MSTGKRSRALICVFQLPFLAPDAVGGRLRPNSNQASTIIIHGPLWGRLMPAKKFPTRTMGDFSHSPYRFQIIKRPGKSKIRLVYTPLGSGTGKIFLGRVLVGGGLPKPKKYLLCPAALDVLNLGSMVDATTTINVAPAG